MAKKKTGRPSILPSVRSVQAQFLIPLPIWQEIKRAAQRRFTTPSEFMRQSVIAALRVDGVKLPKGFGQ
jgi:hypothetical protein